MSDDVKPKEKKQPTVFMVGPVSDGIMKDSGLEPLNKGSQDSVFSIVHQASGSASKKKAPRMAFTETPQDSDHYAGIYKNKSGLVPDFVIKQVRVQNQLVASILRARGNMISMFGHVRRDRFDLGLEIELKPEFLDVVKPSQMAKIKERISLAEKLMTNCGHTTGIKMEERMSLSEFFYLQAINGVSFGRFSTEFIHNSEGEEKKLHRFRPVDAGTILAAANRDASVGDGIRKKSIGLLKEISGKQKINIDLSKLETTDEYAWIQVVAGTPVQAFTNKEMLVFNLYPSTDVEHKGYPVTPIDTCMQAITTHLSIDEYNKLYFQNGRAAKGMLVLKSDEATQETLDNVKQQFNASINSVDKSFRVPIFGIGTTDDVSWQPMTSSSGDGEFQFLYDQVARNILAAFNMSPDELPGYGHLSRGTNQSNLSESSSEFKLTAARDTGIRPLILKFQAFMNDHIFPLIDEELAQICTVQLSGLDAQNKDQEALRLQQDSPIHMTYDQVMQAVDKEPIGKFLGGDFPLNERIAGIIDKYLDVSQIYNHFMDNPAAAFDPMLQFKRDAFWFQNLQLLQQTSPATVEALYAPKPYSIDFLKMLIQDSIEDSEE